MNLFIISFLFIFIVNYFRCYLFALIFIFIVIYFHVVFIFILLLYYSVARRVSGVGRCIFKGEMEVRGVSTIWDATPHYLNQDGDGSKESIAPPPALPPYWPAPHHRRWVEAGRAGAMTPVPTS